MSAHDEEKRALEEWAARYFLPLYNAERQKTFGLVSQQDRPDTVIEAADGTKLGMEIAHLYTDDEEARMLLGRSPNRCHGVQRFDDTLTKLNALLEEKEQQGRAYRCPHPMLLLIRSASPIFTCRDLRRQQDEIRAPKGTYQESWLLPLADDGSGWSRLLRLQ